MRKELILAMLIYFETMFTLLITVYRFLENWDFVDFQFFIAGALVFLVAVGWGYVLTALIFAPTKQMEETLTSLTDNILHELNIPLATIQANTSMLKKNMDDEKSLKRLERIENASFRLKKLYDELVYSIRKEMQDVEKESFELSRLIEERIAIFEEQKRNPFVLKLESLQIETDKIGFEQMFDNIVSNAMKYSSKIAPIYISIKGHNLSIEDKGIGMSSTELLQIHERYYQADAKKEGDGIGLALVKAYCDEEGVKMHVQSKKGEGTVWDLDLKKVQT